MNAPFAVKSAARVLDLLELFSNTPVALGVSAVARHLNFPKSSAHMLLTTLEQRGFLVSNLDRHFQLHPSFSPDARAWIGGSRGYLLRIARPEMRALVDETNESCLLGVMRPDWMTEYIEKVVSTQELRIDTPLGTTRAPNAGSSGLVLLAFQPEAELDKFFFLNKLQRCTPRTICDPKRLRRELSAIRERGFAISEGTFISHITGVSAPISNAHGNVIAALSVGAPSPRFTAIRDRAIEGVVGAARTLSAKLAEESAFRTDRRGNSNGAVGSPCASAR